MTAIAVFTQPSRGAVYVAADAALYDREGIVDCFETKTLAVERWPGVVVNTGCAALGPLVADSLGEEFSSWDEMVAGADAYLARVGPEWWIPTGADVILAGIATERGPEAFTFRVDESLPPDVSREEADASKYFADKPFKLVKLGTLVMTPIPDDQIIPANWEGIRPTAHDEEIFWFLKKLITMQRHMKLPPEIGGIGGWATATKISANGIEERVIARWPNDQAGAPIRPAPIKWNRWHRDNPRPRRFSRKEIARRSELTQQRLQLLGDLASIEERVGAKESELTQIRQQNSLVTATDAKRILDYYRAQEEYAKASDRVSTLGSAATDAEKYGVTIQGLQLKLQAGKISQSDFNRAAFEAVPLFATLKSGIADFATELIEGLVKGQSATETLKNSLAGLGQTLTSVGSHSLVNSLFADATGGGGLLGGGLTNMLGLSSTLAGPVGALKSIRLQIFRTASNDNTQDTDENERDQHHQNGRGDLPRDRYGRMGPDRRRHKLCA